ncbi:cytochrome-c peroxidase [Schlesneria paludicola]|uniref:cytochrome-c peroxidase n=1 Tax=Schlesneria paludicola TaxID=360056 RepID=UPI000299D11F|nr:cytochrome c peroxidase [Schlesneria paludicola]
MSIWKGTCSAVLIVVTVFGGIHLHSEEKRASDRATGDGKGSILAGEVPPLPEPGRLADPRSLQQTGLPIAATRSLQGSDNVHSQAMIALGQKLFFDGRLSANGTVSCATCHDPARAFTDGRATSIGIHGRIGQRNSPTVLNALYNKFQFWDGRAKSIEEQASLPLVNPLEMGQPGLDAVVSQVAAVKEYRVEFQNAFGRSVNATDLLQAIASYEKTLVAFDSPFDHFINGDKNAIDESSKRGWELFNTKARCNLCHALTDTERDVTYFQDNDFHNIGIGIIRHKIGELALRAEELVASGDSKAIDDGAIGTDFSSLGRFLITKSTADTAAYKTPNLRNVLVTGPYFHDGSQETLWDALDHYNKGAGLSNPWLDKDIQPLALSEQDIDDVIAFLASLTSGDYQSFGRSELKRQYELSRSHRPQRDTVRAFGGKNSISSKTAQE